MPNHPLCPRCESQMNSNGAMRWICTGCGYSPLKCHHERERPDYTERAPCPACGIYYGMILDSQRLHCGGCGKRYRKNWQDSPVKQEDVVLSNCKFCESKVGGGITTL